MQTPFDTLFEQAQPDTTKILAAPFLISVEISKRALLLCAPGERTFYRVKDLNPPGSGKGYEDHNGAFRGQHSQTGMMLYFIAVYFYCIPSFLQLQTS